MARVFSAGLLPFRGKPGSYEVLLGHPGGPFWKNKDLWGFPKGQIEEGEAAFDTAIREFKEETGFELSDSALYYPLADVLNKSKTVHVWAFHADYDPSKLNSILFEMEWPKKSGKFQKHPELDKLAWFGLKEAEKKILPYQLGVLDSLRNLRFNEFRTQTSDASCKMIGDGVIASCLTNT